MTLRRISRCAADHRNHLLVAADGQSRRSPTADPEMLYQEIVGEQTEPVGASGAAAV
jgi:hypothetical protein